MIVKKKILCETSRESTRPENKILAFVLLFLFSVNLTTSSAQSSHEVRFNLDLNSEDSPLLESLDNPKVVKILSIDGGGIRGLIPLYFLKKLEEKIGKPIAQTFDVIAGTSTGGIIAMGLSVPDDPRSENPSPKYSPDDLMKLYTTNGDQIFGYQYKNWFSFSGLWRPRYSSDGINQVAETLFGDQKLSEAVTNIVVPSFEPVRYKPLIFNSHSAKQSNSKNFYMRDVAVATSSAPTYFEPKRLQNFKGETYTAIDGGLIMNNPTMDALATAREIYPEAQDFIILSLGTGRHIQRFQYESIQKAGGIKWIKPLMSIMMDGVASVVDYEMNQFFPEYSSPDGKRRKSYFRIQPTILECDACMDDTSEKHTRSLLLAAESAWDENKSDLNALIKCVRIEDESSEPQLPLKKTSLQFDDSENSDIESSSLDDLTPRSYLKKVPEVSLVDISKRDAIPMKKRKSLDYSSLSPRSNLGSSPRSDLGFSPRSSQDWDEEEMHDGLEQ